VTRRHTTVKAGKLKRTANHIRQTVGTGEELGQLGRSFLDRPLYPIIATSELEILDGNRRQAGVLLVAGPEAEVPVCLTDEPWSDAVKLEIQMESAEHQRGLSPYELYLGASQWLALNNGATARNLAEKIQLHEGHLSKVLSLAKCTPAWHEAASAGRVGVSDWSEAAKVSEREQRELLEMKLRGASRDQLARHARQRRNGDQPKVRTSRLKCELGRNLSVIVAGDNLGMDEVIEALGTAQKEARKARDQNLDVKTWSAVMRDRSRNGG
jgi:ParB family chromosome partitioning protein